MQPLPRRRLLGGAEQAEAVIMQGWAEQLIQRVGAEIGAGKIKAEIAGCDRAASALKADVAVQSQIFAYFNLEGGEMSSIRRDQDGASTEGDRRIQLCGFPLQFIDAGGAGQHRSE